MIDKIAPRADLATAVDHAMAGQWDSVEPISRLIALHGLASLVSAVLHKIEGDEQNSRYWYRRSGQNYESWSDPQAELQAIKAVLTY